MKIASTQNCKTLGSHPEIKKKDNCRKSRILLSIYSVIALRLVGGFIIYGARRSSVQLQLRSPRAWGWKEVACNLLPHSHSRLSSVLQRILIWKTPKRFRASLQPTHSSSSRRRGRSFREANVEIKLQQATKPQCGHEFLTLERNMLINNFETFMPFFAVSWEWEQSAGTRKPSPRSRRKREKFYCCSVQKDASRSKFADDLPCQERIQATELFQKINWIWKISFQFQIAKSFHFD